mmetsp:Transcript_29780/g.76461  ORF Transcript_29780/g.76461 Transcript_29780/m.76461 type:complete len:340 (+) Transcript_29780:42-1061(+)
MGAKQVKFQMVPPPKQGFAPPYPDDPKHNMGFLVPGDEELFLGGGALNGAVGQVLAKAHFEEDRDKAHRWTGFKFSKGTEFTKSSDGLAEFDQDKCAYAKYQRVLFEAARQKRTYRKVYEAEPKALPEELPVSKSFCRVFSTEPHPFGAVFMHVLEENARPGDKKHRARNFAVLYTVGVLGKNAKAPGEGEPKPGREKLVKKKAEDFVRSLYDTGANVVTVANHYNRTKKSSDPALQCIRVPIVSGGTFRHPDVSAELAAVALLAGMQSVKYTSRQQLIVELMPSNDMESAFKKMAVHPNKPQTPLKPIRTVLASASNAEKKAFRKVIPSLCQRLLCCK